MAYRLNPFTGGFDSVPGAFEIVIPLTQPGALTTVSTAYDELYYQPFAFDLSKYSGYTGVYFKAILSQNNVGTFDVSIKLLDMTAYADVTGTEMTATLDQYETNIVVSGNIVANLTTGDRLYRPRMKVAAGGLAVLSNCALVVRY